MGKLVDEHNGPIFELHKHLKLPNNALTRIRVRNPDPYRPRVGCNDFVVKDYKSFKRKFLNKNPENLRLIKRPEYEMIEFFDPDYDVLAYMCSKKF